MPHSTFLTASEGRKRPYKKLGFLLRGTGSLTTGVPKYICLSVRAELHFGLSGKIDGALTAHVSLFAQRLLASDPVKVIAHFCDASVPFEAKLEFMRSHHHDRAVGPVALFESRSLIAHAFSLPARPSVAEIGAYRGDFSATLLSELRPGKLTLTPCPIRNETLQRTCVFTL